MRADDPLELKLWRDALSPLDNMVQAAINEDIFARRPVRSGQIAEDVLQSSGVLVALVAIVFREDPETSRRIASAMIEAAKNALAV